MPLVLCPCVLSPCPSLYSPSCPPSTPPPPPASPACSSTSAHAAGEKIFIEVKTTEGGLNTSFDISSNEVLVSNEKENLYYIYRIFNYDKEKNSGEFYIMKGSITTHFNLEATQYKALYKGDNND